MAEEKKTSTKSQVKAETKTAKTSEKKEKATTKTSTKVSEQVEKSNNGLQVVILVLLIIQIVLTLGLIMTVSTSSGSDNSEIAEKVDRLDTFFAANAPGYGSDQPQAPSAPGQQAPAEKVSIEQLQIEGEPFMGDENAPVTIVEFSDYECPFCTKFVDESLQKLKEEYVETGKVKLVFKDFPLGFHDNAKPAAAAANCIQAQLGNEKYFEMHDLLFANQRSLTQKNFEMWAKELGADVEKFTACTQDEQVLAEIDADLALGSQLGVSGTPSFFINGELIVGAQPFAVIKQKIEENLQ